MSKRQFKPLQSVEPSDVDLEAFAERRGMPSLKAVRKEPENAAQFVSDNNEAPAPVSQSTAPTTRVAFEAPIYLSDQLKRRALDQRCSTRFIVLQALREAGFEIKDEDMITDGRRLR